MSQLLSTQQQRYLQLMGIDVWLDRANQTTSIDTALEDNAVVTTVSRDTLDQAWDALSEQVSSCQQCGLHTSRTQTVFGVGNCNADWLIIGEAPGAEEDRKGEPFVGRAGKLLDAMLEAVGLDRQRVYVANILKCRPPNNRNPKIEEAVACEEFLKRQIALVNPKIILALGRIAAQNLLKVDTSIGRMREKIYEYPEPKVPIIATYHPAYLLRSPREKRKAWEDLQLAMKIVEENG